MLIVEFVLAALMLVEPLKEMGVHYPAIISGGLAGQMGRVDITKYHIFRW